MLLLSNNEKPVPDAVFLNIPYDKDFEPLYLAYIVGLVHLGLEPRATLQITDGTRRLDKIFELIKSCRYSIHDLSRVQLNKNKPRVPRFNMPFELGMAVAWESTAPSNSHTWFAFEEVPYRLQMSLSDLNGTDPHIHEGTAAGVFRGLRNALIRVDAQPTARQMMRTYDAISSRLPAIMKKTGAESSFEARAFQAIIYTTRAMMNQGME